MDPAIVAAIIAAAIGLLTLVGTLIVQIYGIRHTSKDTAAIVQEQLDHERPRTLNERFATAADRLGADKSAAVRLAAV